METKRKLLIKKLLSMQHLNVPERKELGQFPSFREVIEAVDEHFKEHHYLPGMVTKWVPDVFCYDGFVLEKTSNPIQPYTLHCQLAGAMLDFSGSTSTEYRYLNDALSVYLQKAYRNNIDGMVFD